MATKEGKSTKLSVGKGDVEEAAIVTEVMAIEIGSQGVKHVAEGVAILEASADVARVGAAALAAGASDLTRAEDALIVADRLETLSQVVAVAGALDLEQGAELLANSVDIEVMSAIVGLMSYEALDRGLELARIGGELDTVRRVVDQLKMPVLTEFLMRRGERLREIASDVIIRAASGSAMQKTLAATADSVGALGANEMVEGMERGRVAEAGARRADELTVAGVLLADRGMTEIEVAAVAADVARAGAAVGIAEIAVGSEEIGASKVLNAVSDALVDSSES